MNNVIEALVKAAVVIIGIAALVFGLAVVSGTILWCIYPHIHDLFPTAAKNGVIAQDLSWWNAVCVTWIFGILLKSSSKSESKSEKK